MKKKYKFLLGIILIFVIINIAWYLIVEMRYKPFEQAVPKNELGIYAINDSDRYTYGIKKPDYLSFVGNLSVSSSENNDALIIWPKIKGGYKYGIIIQIENKGYQFYVDENMNLIANDNIDVIKDFEENSKKIKYLFNKANEMWNLTD